MIIRTQLSFTRGRTPGVFCDDHASNVHAEYVSKEKEKLSEMQTQAETYGTPIPDCLPLVERTELFKKVAGGAKKGGGLYGTRLDVEQFYDREHRARSSLPESSSAQEVVDLRQTVKDLQEEVARGKEKRDEAITKAVNDAISQTPKM